MDIKSGTPFNLSRLVKILKLLNNFLKTVIVLHVIVSCAEVNLQSFSYILRLLDILPNFPFTTSETMGNYYLQTWYIRVAE